MASIINNRNILCIATPQWKSDYASTTVELMKIFGQHNMLLYVSSGYTVKDVFTAFLKGERLPFAEIFGFKSRLKTVFKSEEGQISLLIIPLQIPVNFLPKGKLYNLLLKINGYIAKRSIVKYLIKLKMQDGLIYINSFNPALGIQTVGRMGELVSIYHCYDEISAAPWMSRHGADLENEMFQLVDATIVTSQGLYEEKKHKTKCFLVKNAADFELFSKAFNPNSRHGRVVGFIGSLDERIDYGLLQFAIEHLPNFNFVFIGRVTECLEVNKLKENHNVTVHDPKPLLELPKFVKEFDVGIIPFRKNRFTKGIYPLKINEYLAAGLPVVTTDFGYLNDFEGMIHIAKDQQQFVSEIQEAIRTNTVEKKLARQSYAKHNSWNNRSIEFSQVICSIEVENKNINKR